MRLCELICAAAVGWGLRRHKAWVYEMIWAREREGEREGLYPIHLTESRSRCSVCPSPAARQGLFPLPLYCFEPQRWAWLHKSGGNATRPLACASCQVPPFMFFCADVSQTPLQPPSLGLAMMLLCLSVFVGRMIRTTPSSRLKALASPCQPAERLR